MTAPMEGPHPCDPITLIGEENGKETRLDYALGHEVSINHRYKLKV